MKNFFLSEKCKPVVKSQKKKTAIGLKFSKTQLFSNWIETISNLSHIRNKARKTCNFARNEIDLQYTFKFFALAGSNMF